MLRTIAKMRQWHSSSRAAGYQESKSKVLVISTGRCIAELETKNKKRKVDSEESVCRVGS